MSIVLVVEDTPSELELISNYLRDSGYTVIGATDAKEALNKVLKQKPDVVVTDVVMPGMSGFELCRTLKKNPVTEQLPIIICSSKNQEIDRFWGMKQGANAYLAKPIDQEEFVRTVKQLIKR